MTFRLRALAVVTLFVGPVGAAFAQEAGRVVVWTGDRGAERLEAATDGTFQVLERTPSGGWRGDERSLDERALRAARPDLHALWTATIAPIDSALDALAGGSEADVTRGERDLVDASRGGARGLVLHRLHAAAAADPLDEQLVRRVHRALRLVDAAEQERHHALLARFRRALLRSGATGEAYLRTGFGHVVVIPGPGSRTHGFVVVGDRVDVETWQADCLLELVETTTLDDLARRHPELHASWKRGLERMRDALDASGARIDTTSAFDTTPLWRADTMPSWHVETTPLWRLDTAPIWGSDTTPLWRLDAAPIWGGDATTPSWRFDTSPSGLLDTRPSGLLDTRPSGLLETRPSGVFGPTPSIDTAPSIDTTPLLDPRLQPGVIAPHDPGAATPR